MKKNTLVILLAVVALIFVAAMFAGGGASSVKLLPIFSETVASTSQTEESPPSQGGKDDEDPVLPTLSFPDSDDITEVYLRELVNGVPVYDSVTGAFNIDYDDPSGMLVPYFDFPEENMVVRINPAIRTWVNLGFWHTRKGSLMKSELTFDGCYESADGSPLTYDVMKDNLHIYTQRDIQKNLELENLTNDQLNYLIDLLVCQGCFIESSVDQAFIWHRDYTSTSGNYFGNRISMRYSVSVPQDIKVTVEPGYEYVLYMFNSLNSYYCNSTVGWTADSSSFVIPANTPFCIALRPEGLGPDADLTDRVLYEYLYTDRWMDIIDFELVKIVS